VTKLFSKLVEATAEDLDEEEEFLGIKQILNLSQN
jgi:hypothetical protein